MITKEEVLKFQDEWGSGIISMSNIFRNGGDVAGAVGCGGAAVIAGLAVLAPGATSLGVLTAELGART